jgi:hypothetical protein
MTDQNRDEGLILPLEMIQRLYEGAGEDASPLPTDRTGGLRFRRGVPEALLHLSRNNRSEVARLVEEAESARRRALTELRNGGTTAVAAVLYWHRCFRLCANSARTLVCTGGTCTPGCTARGARRTGRSGGGRSGTGRSASIRRGYSSCEPFPTRSTSVALTGGAGGPRSWRVRDAGVSCAVPPGLP